MELVEQTIKNIKKVVAENLDNQLKAIDGINDSNHIQKVVSKSIEGANDSLQPYSTFSWNELVSQTVVSNILSEELKAVIGTKSVEALSNAIQNEFISMGQFITSMITNDLKDLYKDMGVLAIVSKFTELKLMVELMKAKCPHVKSQHYDAAKIWNEMKNVDPNDTFSAFVIDFDGKGETFHHVTIISDKEFEGLLNNPLLSFYAYDVIGSFVKVGTLKGTQPPKPTTQTLTLESSNSERESKTNGFAFYRSGCKLQSIGNKHVFSADDQCLSSKLICPNARIWINFWKDFFKQVVTNKSCEIKRPMNHQNRISGGLIEPTTRDHNNWYVIPLCEAHMNDEYKRGSTQGPMKTENTTIALQIPIKPFHNRESRVCDLNAPIANEEIKTFTEKDFKAETFLGKECFLKFPLPTYGIGTISMEYKWKVKGKNQVIFRNKIN